ncbi:hypothetical protein R6Z07F_019234 [Ovis aries]
MPVWHEVTQQEVKMDGFQSAIGQAAARSEPAAPRAPPGRLQLAAVAWGAAGGRGSVTALRRALGGIVAVQVPS